MKKSVIAILSAFALVSFVSCTKDVPAVVAPAEGEVAFTVGGEGIISTEVETRASVVESLSSFHVGAVTGTAGSSETEAWNAVFSGGPTYTGGKFWPASNPNYTFYASSLDMTASRTGYTVSATNATDVVCAYLPNPGFKAVNKLVFEHVFARLGDVTVTAAENYSLSNISITVTPKTGGTYNLFTGAGKTDGTGWSSTTSGSSAGIANATPGTKSNDIYLVPGTYTLTASWTATRGDSVQQFTGKTQTVSLVGGKVNRLTTTLGGSASEIEFTVEVTPWGEVTVPVSFSTE